MRQLFHPIIEQIELTEILNALGDPVRLKIIKQLSNEFETTCGACEINLPKPALSHHFRVLRESGMIKVRIEGKNRYLSLRYEELESKFPGVLSSIIKNI